MTKEAHVNDLPTTSTGRYLLRFGESGVREAWWEPPGGAPRERLRSIGWPQTKRRNVRGQLRDAGEAILLHATSDLATALDYASTLRDEVLGRPSGDGDVEVPVRDLERWLRECDLPLAPGWGPLGVQPVVDWLITEEGVERYTVALDGWDLLRVDLPDSGAVAQVGVTDLKQPEELSWTRPVLVAEPGDEHQPAAPGERVRTDPLPFGGWAVQVDEFDVAIVERHPTALAEVRVAVYDRTPDSGFLVFDEGIRYRQMPVEVAGLGERLRAFTGTSGRARVLGR